MSCSCNKIDSCIIPSLQNIIASLQNSLDNLPACDCSKTTQNCNQSCHCNPCSQILTSMCDQLQDEFNALTQSITLLEESINCIQAAINSESNFSTLYNQYVTCTNNQNINSNNCGCCSSNNCGGCGSSVNPCTSAPSCCGGCSSNMNPCGPSPSGCSGCCSSMNQCGSSPSSCGGCGSSMNSCGSSPSGCGGCGSSMNHCGSSSSGCGQYGDSLTPCASVYSNISCTPKPRSTSCSSNGSSYTSSNRCPRYYGCNYTCR